MPSTHLFILFMPLSFLSLWRKGYKIIQDRCYWHLIPYLFLNFKMFNIKWFCFMVFIYNQFYECETCKSTLFLNGSPIVKYSVWSNLEIMLNFLSEHGTCFFVSSVLMYFFVMNWVKVSLESGIVVYAAVHVTKSWTQTATEQ